MTTLGLKNVNMLSKEQYNEIEEPATDELYAISGSGFGFPSERYDDLELGASGTQYIAPANGWFFCACTGASGSTYFELTTRLNGVCASYTGGCGRAMLPVKKGTVMVVYYGGTNFQSQGFRFIYAEGE